MWVGLVFPLWLGSTRADLKVTSVDSVEATSESSAHQRGAPRSKHGSEINSACWLVPLDGEVVVAPKERARQATDDDDEDNDGTMSTDVLPPGVSVDVSLRITTDAGSGSLVCLAHLPTFTSSNIDTRLTIPQPLQPHLQTCTTARYKTCPASPLHHHCSISRLV